MKTKRRGLLFVVAAPSGAGKTTLCKALMERMEKDGEPPFHWSISYTTRSPRQGEEDGRDYFFIGGEEFDRMVKAGEFAEWAEVHDKRYGTSKAGLEQAAQEGRDLLVEIDIQGANNLRGQYRDACFIFILPPSWGSLEERLRGRNTESADEVNRRLVTAGKEVLEWKKFDYIIVNDRFGKAVDHLRSVVLAERSKKEVMELEVGQLLAGFKKEGK